MSTDDFNRSNADPIGGNWTTPSGASTFRIVSNSFHTTSSGSDPWIAYWNADTFDADQYSQFGVLPAIDKGGPAVRIGTSTLNGYMYTLRQTNLTRLYKRISGSYTQIAAYTDTATTTSVFKISAVGSTLTVYIGGSQVGQETDTALEDGVVGAMSSTSAANWDNWEGGNVEGAAAGQPTIKRWGGIPGMAINRGVW